MEIVTNPLIATSTSANKFTKIKWHFLQRLLQYVMLTVS